MQQLLRIEGETEFRVDVLPESPGRANSYLMTYGDKAWIIDPSAGPGVCGKEAAANVAGLIVTHGHYDHIAALDEWRKEHALPVIGHAKLNDYLADAAKNVSLYFGRPQTYKPADVVLHGGLGERCRPADAVNAQEPDVSWTLAEGLTIETRYYPGHTASDTAVLVRADGKEAVMFTGDIVFDTSIGRNDLPDGSPADQIRSLARLKEWLSSLPAELSVFSVHGPDTTVREILEGNPYLT